LLEFDAELGVGFEPFTYQPQYGQEYFNKYVEMGRSTFGVALNSLRAGLVSKYISFKEPLIDIGVGDGAFIRARGWGTYGYDINPVAYQALNEQFLWRYVPDFDAIESVSFWDSLEHIEDPQNIIQRVTRFCFVSLPIFRDEQHVLESKHYRPSEHCWYFTKAGLIKWFWDLGFSCVEMNDMETALGREDIGTFVFQRVR
jgi:hypothetical protein